MNISIQTNLFDNQTEDEENELKALKDCARSQIDEMWREFSLDTKPTVPKIEFFDYGERDSEGRRTSSGYFNFASRPRLLLCRSQQLKGEREDFLRKAFSLSHELSHYMHYKAIGRKEFVKFYSNRSLRESFRLGSSDG